MSLPFLLEIGTEEIPDWMIPGALGSLRTQLEGLGITARMDATPRRLVARAEGLPDRLPDTEERVNGSAQERARESRRRISPASKASRRRIFRSKANTTPTSVRRPAAG
jgi:glycyl-tRNA synthetase beta subunit